MRAQYVGPRPMRVDQSDLETPGLKYFSIIVLQSPDTVSRFKSALNNVLLYLGLIGYTALGAKIFQLLELPTEKERLETNQALLLTERVIFLQIIANNTDLEEEQYNQVRLISPISPDQSDPSFL